MSWAALQELTNTAVLSVFGESVSVGGVIVQADFHEPDEEIMLGENSVMSPVPRLVMKSADVPASPVGLPVVAKSRNFIIAEVKPDGRGMTMIELEAA